MSPHHHVPAVSLSRHTLAPRVVRYYQFFCVALCAAHHHQQRQTRVNNYTQRDSTRVIRESAINMHSASQHRNHLC